MANVKFIIRKSDVDELQSIYVSCRFGRNEKLLYATPLKTEPMFWDADRMRVKVSRYCSYTDSVNTALSSLSSKIDGFIVKTAGEGGRIGKEPLREMLDLHFGKKKASEDFHEFFKYYIDLCDTRLNCHRGGQTISYKGKREYARTLYYIEEYERSRRVRLDFCDIDLDFYEDFVSFLETLNLSTNTIGNKITFLKALMEAAYKRGLTDNIRYKSFRSISEPSDSVALDEEELSRVARCNLRRHPRLEKVRDIFLVCCWTGLRFSDISRLGKVNIIDGKFINIRQSKTDKPVVIPIHPVVSEIWERYGNGLPRVISNQKFNEYVKSVCKAARIRTSVQKSITKGGKRTTTVYEKWQLVSSHTARRSFASNLYRSGFPSISIMQITGHKTETAFLKYIKVSREEHANLLAEHWRRRSAVDGGGNIKEKE